MKMKYFIGTLAEDPETSIQVFENSAHAVRMNVM